MFVLIVLFFGLLLSISCGRNPTPAERARALAAKMSLTEQLAMLHGYHGPYVGNVASQPNHGIPELHLEDGPQGVADGVKEVTCWPNALSIVSTFDVSLMEEYASALAEEQRGKGTNVMLGPMTNLARVPMGGRNFESFGEDPFLASEMMYGNIHGIQKNGVIATVKHYFNNNQEFDRGTVSANVDSRTEHEIYYPPFQAAVDAGVGAVMCSYNKVNDTYACENAETLTEALRQRMGFQGFVMSDWGGTHSTVESANAGLEMEMPSDTYFGKALQDAVSQGKVQKSRIFDMVVKILTPMFAVGIMDTPQTGNLSVNVQSKQHTALARSLAEKIAVLIRNDGVLPLGVSAKQKIAIIGDDGGSSAIVTGGGSGHVVCPYVVAPVDGIKNRVSESLVTYAPTHPISDAAKVAAAADIAIVFVGTTSSEGRDRKDLGLGSDQDELIEAVAQAQTNTIVVLNVPGAVLMPWIAKVRAAVIAWYPGQEFGNSIASVLFGDVNPSSRLPMSFPFDASHMWLKTEQQYPGVRGDAVYSEKLLMGYRWFDATKESPLFPFGHGLSYTSFAYRNMTVSGSLKSGQGKVTVNLEVTNSGSLQGREVVQLYIGFPSGAGEPPKLLRGFQCVDLNAGETNKNVQFEIQSGPGLSIWDVTIDDWKAILGTFDVYVGASSGDIRLTGSFVVE